MYSFCETVRSESMYALIAAFGLGVAVSAYLHSPCKSKSLLEQKALRQTNAQGDPLYSSVCVAMRTQQILRGPNQIRPTWL